MINTKDHISVVCDSVFIEAGVNCKRSIDFVKFTGDVLNHIETYTVPQYGDKGADQASELSPEELIWQAKKYLNRFGKNQRPGQEESDLLKAAHYIQMAFTKMQESK